MNRTDTIEGETSAPARADAPLLERLAPETVARRGSESRTRRRRPLGIAIPVPRSISSVRLGAVLTACIRALGLETAGRREAAGLAIRENRIVSGRLPAAFHGTRILHLSDLHLDTTPGGVGRLLPKIESLSFDCAVITGDLNSFEGNFSERDARALRSSFGERPVYVSLGNHDSLADAAHWERCGFTILVNEAIAWKRGVDRLTIAAIDDLHYLEDPGDRIASLATASFDVLLSHTPDVFREAARAGFDVMLSGHTHGGQICAPGGFPVVRNAKAPRAYCAGAWAHDRLQGYTSRGTGCSGVPFRLHCPPEIVLHTIVREDLSPS